MGRNKKTLDEFIADARVVHGDRYDYSLVKYVGARDKIKIICSEHGEYTCRAHAHLVGSGCTYCTGSRCSTEMFIKKAIAIHGDRYDYSRSNYKDKQKVIIICKEHGEFSQWPNHHLVGKGCSECYGNTKKTTEDFVSDARAVHGAKYEYTKVEYASTRSEVIIICKEHGDFPQTPHSHLQGAGCPSCAKYGFDTLKPSVFYLYNIEDNIGFGISNDFKKRHATHLKNFEKSGVEAQLLKTFDMPGQQALDLETDVKRTMNIINTGIDGFKTEAIHSDDLPLLIEKVKNNLKLLESV